MLRRSFSLVAALVLLASQAQLAAATTIGTPVNATADEFTNNEITIALNPTDPSNVIIGYNDWNRNEGCGMSYSLDGGQTWAPHSFIPGITRYDNNGDTYEGNGIYDFAGDPAATFGPDGTAYFACYGYLYGTAAAPMGGVALFVSRSDDGGATWSDPVKLSTFTAPGNGFGVNKGSNGQFPDHESIAADTWVGSPHYGSIYVAQAQFHGNTKAPITLFASHDGGVTWSKPVTVSSGRQYANQDAHPFVGPDGSVYVTFDSQLGGNIKSPISVRIAKSTDGGASFGPSHTVVNMVDATLHLPNSDYRGSSFPSAGIDGDGRITVVWNDGRGGGASNMWYTRADGTDLTSWTTPAQLKPSDGEQFFPWVSTAPNGRVDIVYYDRTIDENDTVNYVTYSRLDPGSGLDVTAASYDVTNQPFDGNRDTGQTTTSCTPFIGDYIGVASDNTHVYLGWTGNGPFNNIDEFGNEKNCDVNQDAFTVAITP